ncbi:hypothetical protein BD289DRAFT_435886 [Coniella lustricola]|uniref:Secreted protein n=1 Tax=Coniella lustricola TaxID=2025994 RepID=A0A2T3A5T9_9PEZI|nr:hypothetical protein BD289DRAFT_435886 [Coniella lustricola]
MGILTARPLFSALFFLISTAVCVLAIEREWWVFADFHQRSKVSPPCALLGTVCDIRSVSHNSRESSGIRSTSQA